MNRPYRTAIIDLGTNTIILLIVEILGSGKRHVLCDEARVVRLGEGIHEHQAFLPAAMERAFAAMTEFKNLIQKNHCTQTIAVGTAGFRNAKNAPEFVQRVQQELGIEIKIISGEHEASLIFNSVRTESIFKNLKPLLVLDIGGGSTELIFDDDNLHEAVSLAFGSVKLTERFLHSDPPTLAELGALDEFILSELKNMTVPNDHKKVSLVATAGTATTISALVQKMLTYDAAQVHGSVVTVSALKILARELAGLKFENRKNLPCLEPKRADVIVAGIHILLGICEFFHLTEFFVSDRGLRYGVLEAGVM